MRLKGKRRIGWLFVLEDGPGYAALKYSAGEKGSTTSEKSDELDAPAAITTITKESKGNCPFPKSNNISTPPKIGSAEDCVDDRADTLIAPSDQGSDKKGDPQMLVPTNATAGYSKARGGTGVLPF
jgi:hypothetical protein